MVDLVSFRSTLDAALSEAVLDIDESDNHIVMEIVPSSR